MDWARALLRAALDPPKSVEPGAQRFGDYELWRELGRGATASVYHAFQHSLQREVALKVMTGAAPADETERQRFRFGAEAAAQLDRHPHIARIFEVGAHDGIPFISMALLKGGSLAQHMGKLREAPQAEGVSLMAKVADAVHHAHQHGVLHRDLKPANIVLDEAGEPFIVDFGLAKHLDERALTSMPSVMAGTIGYMAPEQAGDPPRALTFAADIFGLGAILYELLTGSPPLQGLCVATYWKELVSASPVPEPRSMCPEIDRELNAICMKALEKEPERRYRSARDMADDLKRWLRNEPISIVPERPLARALRWCRVRPALATMLGGALCVLFATILVGVSVAQEQTQGLLRDVQRSNLYEAEAKAYHVLFQLRALAIPLARCAADARVAELLAHDGAPAVPQDRLLSECEANRTFDTIALVTRDGTVRAALPHLSAEAAAFASRRDFEGARRLADREYRAAHVGGIILVGGEEYATLSAPVFGADNAWLGAVCVGIKIPTLLETLRMHEDGNHSVRLVGVREDPRDDPAHARGAMALLDKIPRRERAAALPNSWFAELSRLKEQALGRDPFRLSELNHSLEDNPIAYPMNAFGKRWLSAFAPVGYTGYAVVVQTNYDFTIERLKLALLRLLGWSGAIFLLGTCVVLALARRLRRRRDLTRG